MTNNVSYTIAMNIYRALGGQQSGFESVEDVYAAIDEIYSAGGGRIVVEPIKQKVSSGGVYTYNDENVTGYKPVEFEVDVPVGFDLTCLDASAELSQKFNEAVQYFLNKASDNIGSWSGDTGWIMPFKPDMRPTQYPQAMDYSIFITKYAKSTDGTLYLYENNNLMIVGEVNVPEVTSLTNLFRQDYQLYYVGKIYAPKCTSLKNAFYKCRSLHNVDIIDAPLVTDISYMFYDCPNLTSIPLLDCSNVTNMNNIFDSNKSLVDIKGFKNLGMAQDFKTTTIYLNPAPIINHESVMNVINNLYDRAAAGYYIITIKLHANSLALLSDNEIAIATNKGWIIS